MAVTVSYPFPQARRASMLALAQPVAESWQLGVAGRSADLPPGVGTAVLEPEPTPLIDVDEALRIIVDEHSPAMYRVARSIVRDGALAEDVVQEAILKAWRGLATFRGDASLRSWVLRITHNTAISMLRKRREEVRDPALLPEDPNPDAAEPERQVAGKLMVDHLWKSLDQLDDLSRTIVVLREIEGMPYEDIAETLQVPLPTVKTRLFRSRRVLAASLTEWT